MNVAVPLLRFRKPSPGASWLLWTSRRLDTHLKSLPWRPAVDNQQFQRLVNQLWGNHIHSILRCIFFLWPPGVLPSSTNSDAMLGYSSHAGVLPYNGPTPRSRVAIYNHFVVSPILCETLRFRHLLSKQLVDPSNCKLSTLLRLRLAAGFFVSSASHRTLRVTRRHLTKVETTVNDALYLFLANFSVLIWTYSPFVATWRKPLIESSACSPPMLIFVNWHLAYIRFLSYRICERPRSSRLRHFWYPFKKCPRYDVILHAWNVLGRS